MHAHPVPSLRLGHRASMLSLAHAVRQVMQILYIDDPERWVLLCRLTAALWSFQTGY